MEREGKKEEWGRGDFGGASKTGKGNLKIGVRDARNGGPQVKVMWDLKMGGETPKMGVGSPKISQEPKKWGVGSPEIGEETWICWGSPKTGKGNLKFWGERPQKHHVETPKWERNPKHGGWEAPE